MPPPGALPAPAGSPGRHRGGRSEGLLIGRREGPGPRGGRTGLRSVALRGFVLLGTTLACAPRSLPPSAPLSEARVSERLAAASTAAGAVRRYQAVLGVRGKGARGGFSGRLLVVFERPPVRGDPAAVASLRMAIFAAMGGPRWTLVARPEGVRAVVPAERAYADGSELGQFTEPFLGIRIGIEQVAALVVGTGVPIRGGAARITPAGSSAVLARGEEIWWDGGRGSAAQIRRVMAGSYEVRYPGSYRRDGRQVPRRMEIESDPVSATLIVEELRVNASLHSDSFRLRIPSGFRLAAVSELAAALRLPDR